MTHTEVSAWVRGTRPTVVAGAGVSAGSGLPLFWPLMEVCLRYLAAGEPLLIRLQASLMTHFRGLAPEELFTSLVEEAGPRSLSLLSLFTAGEPTTAHLALSRAASEHGLPIVTTNFDLLFEKAARQQGIALDLTKVHGSADNLKSIRVAVDQVSVVSSPRVRRLVHEKISGRPLLVLGYRGLDSDFFPVLQEATAVVWLLHGVLPAGTLPPDYRHLASIPGLRVTYGDSGDLAQQIAGTHFSTGGVLSDWQGEIRQWAEHLPRLARYRVFGKLLRHVGLAAEASECYGLILQEGVTRDDSVWQAFGHDGLMKSDGLMRGDSAATATHFKAFTELARATGVRARASALSVVLNCREAQMVAGSTPLRIRWWLLAPPYPLSRSEIDDLGWLLNQWGRVATASSHYGRARVLLLAALAVFRLLADFQGYSAATWSLCVLDLPLGDYKRIIKRMRGFSPEDMRFIGLVFGYWLEWLNAEVDRLQGRPDLALGRLNASPFKPLNRDERFWDAVTRAACLRAQGTTGLPAIRAVQEPFHAPFSPQRLRQEAYVLAEEVLGCEPSSSAREVLESRLNSALSVARSSGNRMAVGYFLASLALLDRTPISLIDLAAMIASPLMFVRVIAVLSNHAPLWRARTFLKPLLRVQCVRKGMCVEAEWLRRGVLPSLVDIQFP